VAEPAVEEVAAEVQPEVEKGESEPETILAETPGRKAARTTGKTR